MFLFIIDMLCILFNYFETNHTIMQNYIRRYRADRLQKNTN